jgi:monolysocardiolipin acyltransferase
VYIIIDAMPKKDESSSPPSLQWRAASTATIALIGLACKGFLKAGTKKTETHGLDNFIKLLDERQDIGQRQRGLLTGETSSSACYFALF